MTNKKKKKGPLPPDTPVNKFEEKDRESESNLPPDIVNDTFYIPPSEDPTPQDVDFPEPPPFQEDTQAPESENDIYEAAPTPTVKDDLTVFSGSDFEDEEEPPDLIKREYELEYHEDRSYLFIFGPGSAGKTVLISSILYYLENTRSIEFGDTIKNINNPNVKHEKEGNRLLKELSTTLFENEFPRGTAKVKVDNPFPRHINNHFLPANNKLPDFKFCLMDMAGDDLHNVDHDSNESLPESIKVYVEKMPKKNMCFLYVLDPNSDAYKKSEQLSIFKAFIDLLDQNEHSDTPLLFIVSKWDKVKDLFANAEEYIKQEFSPIWGVLNQKSRNITYTSFSIGEVNESNDRIRKYDPAYSEKVFNWWYQIQTGKSLLSNNEKKGKSFSNNMFKK